jgi:hypothetical protein
MDKLPLSATGFKVGPEVVPPELPVEDVLVLLEYDMGILAPLKKRSTGRQAPSRKGAGLEASARYAFVLVLAVDDE